MANAGCDLCIPPGMVWYAVLAAVIDATNGDTVPDAQTLMSELGCLTCVPPGMVPYVILQALRSGGLGGGGSGGGVASGAGPPVADPGETAALYIDTNDGTLYMWYSGAWH